ncbi:RDD family protein [Streptomyces sp. NPDC127114]|uniref:RDD family protein n=1 Tax=Streptomyces sp. NPDC127114 TaxID=3345366 RepID=UPI003632918A
MSGVVTGDAVYLGLQPARLPSRALALLLDLVVVWAAYLLISLGLAVATASLDEAAARALAIASFLLVLVGAPIAVETLSHGRSLGKLACGLRVVREDGGPIRFRHALMRGAMGVVEILMTFGAVACIASLVSERGRRIGDVFAGTLVVRERVASGAGMVVPPPPPWIVGRFAGLDLSAVPDGLWLEIRQYLTRMRQLDPAIGQRLAERLADELVARTGAPPPPGVPVAAYLAGVVAERQGRDARRAFAVGAVGTAGKAGMAGMAGSPGVAGAPGIAGVGGTRGAPGMPGVAGPHSASGAPEAAGAAGLMPEFPAAHGGVPAAGPGAADVSAPGHAASAAATSPAADSSSPAAPAAPPATGFAPPA